MFIHPSQATADIDEEKIEEILAEEYLELRGIVDQLPGIDMPDEAAKPFGLDEGTFDSLDFGALVAMRRAHQTYQAAHGIRTKQSPDETDETTKKKVTLRRRIIRKFHEALRESQDEQAVGTGKERSARWQANHAPGGRDGKIDGTAAPELVSGNSANAALAASAVAKKVWLRIFYIYSISNNNVAQAATRRKNIFAKAMVPRQGLVYNARVTALKPLKLGDYGIIFTEKGLRVGKGMWCQIECMNTSLTISITFIVISLYSKTGGRYGKHGDIAASSDISAISNAGLQVFEHTFRRAFRDIPQATAHLQTRQYVIIPPSSFLCLLASPPNLTRGGLELSEEDIICFMDLLRGEEKFKAAMKLFRKRKDVGEELEDE